MFVQGKTVLVVVDAYSKWLEVFVTNNMTTETTIYILRSLFARFGLPRYVVSDNAANFCSNDFINFIQLNGIIHQTGAPFHAATNGEAENAVKTVKRALIRIVTEGCVNLNLALNRFLMDYRNTPHCTTGVSPASLLLGRKLRNRFDLLKPNNVEPCKDAVIRNHVNFKQGLQRKYYHGKRDVNLVVGEGVMVRDYRIVNKPAWVKGVIHKVLGSRTYLVKIENLNVIWKRHINQLNKVNTPFSQSVVKQAISEESIPIVSNAPSVVVSRPKRNINPPVRYGYYLSEEV